MWAMERLRQYLLGRKFVLRIDHKPLVNLLKNPINRLLEGWIDTILTFDFETQYIEGNFNHFADALSRQYEEPTFKLSTIKSSSTSTSNSSSVIDDNLTFAAYEAEKRGKTVPDENTKSELIKRYHSLGHFSVNMLTKRFLSNGYW